MSQIHTYTPPERLTVVQAQEEHGKLLTLVHNDQIDEILVDAHALKKIDTSGVQLLLGLKKSLDVLHKKMAFKGDSQVLDDALNLMGLDKQFNL